MIAWIWYTSLQFATSEFMDTLIFRPKTLLWTAAILLPAFILSMWFFFPRSSAHAANERIITIFHDGQEQTVASNAETVGEVLERANITIGESDAVEPSKETKLVAANYSVNVYRARPVTVVDGHQRYRVMTPHTSAKKIVEAAGLNAYDEDILTLDRIDDFLEGGGAGLKLTIKRSTPLTFILYGKTVQARTQATTVAELLKEKSVELGKDDGVSPGQGTAIIPGMTVSVYRNGSQVANEEQEIAFQVEQIKDADKDSDYKQIKEPGTKGKKLVTYQIELRDGKEVGRKEIQSVVTTQPKKQVEVVGTKSKFSGSLAEWLRILRTCETGGNYARNSSNGLYYGAYQFRIDTWNAVARKIRPDLVGVRPDQASPADQDAMIIANTKMSRGGLATQNPGCYAKYSLSQFPPN